ncbi:NTPase [Methanocaldococcus sp. 10A]
MRIYITGMPGVGKTTLVLKIAEKLKDFGYKVGGFITKEIRKDRKRVGFKIITIDTNEEVILAYIGEGKIKVGKYCVFVENLDKVGVEAIKRALEDADIIIIDELGAMEFKNDNSPPKSEFLSNNK